MKAPDERPKVKLTGRDGNAFFILGTVKNALKKAGADQEYIDKYMDEAMSDDYDSLLATTMKYVEVS